MYDNNCVVRLGEAEFKIIVGFNDGATLGILELVGNTVGNTVGTKVGIVEGKLVGLIAYTHCPQDDVGYFTRVPVLVP